MELTFYFIKATIVIAATVLTVDIQWTAISFFQARNLELTSYLAGNSEVELRWWRDAILVLVVYPVATAMCFLAWQALSVFRKAARNYNERLDLFANQAKQANVGDDSHDAPCQPAISDEKKEEEEARETQHPAESNAREEEERSEDHDGGASPMITSVNSLVGNDWELVEDDLRSEDASNALAKASHCLEPLNMSTSTRAAWEYYRPDGERRYMEMVDMLRSTDSDEEKGSTGPTPSTESDEQAGTELELKRFPSKKPVHYADGLIQDISNVRQSHSTRIYPNGDLHFAVEAIERPAFPDGDSAYAVEAIEKPSVTTQDYPLDGGIRSATCTQR